MRDIEQTTKFRRDYKREQKSDANIGTVLADVLELLVSDTQLPQKLRDHGLSGDWKGFRDCHIKPDLVLIYEKVGDDLLRLVRLGSHSELFN